MVYGVHVWKKDGAEASINCCHVMPVSPNDARKRNAMLQPPPSAANDLADERKKNLPTKKHAEVSGKRRLGRA